MKIAKLSKILQTTQIPNFVKIVWFPRDTYNPGVTSTSSVSCK